MAEPWWRTGPHDVHRLEDRISSLYAERCHIDRDDNAIVLVNKVRTVHVPAAWLAVLLVGPGSRITHPAVTLLANSVTAVCWVGEQGVRLYAKPPPVRRQLGPLRHLPRRDRGARRQSRSQLRPHRQCAGLRAGHRRPPQGRDHHPLAFDLAAQGLTSERNARTAGTTVVARTAGRDCWTPVDCDGFTLIARPRQGGQAWRSPNEVKQKGMNI